MINSSRANLSLDLLSFFLQNDSLVFSSTSTFHPYILLVYFTVRRGELLNLPKFYRASSVPWRLVRSVRTISAQWFPPLRINKEKAVKVKVVVRAIIYQDV